VDILDTRGVVGRFLERPDQARNTSHGVERGWRVLGFVPGALYHERGALFGEFRMVAGSHPPFASWTPLDRSVRFDHEFLVVCEIQGA
jgi:hypothetical protein